MTFQDIAWLYRDGRRYDLQFASDYDVPFWVEKAREYGDPVLELACGTGRVAIPLAKEGFHVTGIDVSHPMLTEARRKSASEGVRIEWIRADIRSFELGTRFGLVFIAANSLLHLLSLNELEACLACVRQHLAPGGRFVLDVFVPDLDVLRRDPGRRFTFSEYQGSDGAGPIIINESNDYDPAAQINRITLYRMPPGQAEEILGKLNLRMYFPQELDAYLRYNGLVIDDKSGNYGGRAFDSSATRQLIVCHAGG